MSLPPCSLHDICQRVVEFLKSREHEEKPHISTLGSDYYLADDFDRHLTGKRTASTIYIDAEELYEDIDPLVQRAPHVFGVYAEFRTLNQSENRVICGKLSFYIRVAPPRAKKSNKIITVPHEEQFRHVMIITKLYNEEELEYEIEIATESKDGQKLSTVSRNGKVKIPPSGEVLLEVPDASYSVINAFPNATKVVIRDAVLKELLSTNYKAGDFEITCRRGIKTPRPLKLEHRFSIRIKAVKKGEFINYGLLLYNFGPVCVDSTGNALFTWKHADAKYYKEPDTDNTWSTNMLLEVEGEVRWLGYEPCWSWLRKIDSYDIAGLDLSKLRPINCLAVDNLRLRRIVLRDWHIAEEHVRDIKKSNRGVRESIELAASRYFPPNLIELIADAVGNAFPKVDKLHTYQERALENILAALEAQDSKPSTECIVLCARTAGGKTLAFILPVLIHSLYRKAEGVNGTKAILFYPTIALCNNQLETILRLIWCLNKMLIERKMPIMTVGVLHGMILDREELFKAYNEGDTEFMLGIKCPECNRGLLWVEIKPYPGQNWAMESIYCDNNTCPCTKGGRLNGLLNSTLKASRDAIYTEPPDVLISNVDIMNVRLTYEPESLSILGRPVKYCPFCFRTYASMKKRTCDRCKKQQLKEIRPCHPTVIVCDEAHLFRGDFGAHAAHVLTRLEQAIRRINGLSPKWRPLYILSSATLSRARERAYELLRTDPKKVQIIKAEYEERLGKSSIRKYHLFIMPKAYSPEATLARTAHKIAEISAGVNKPDQVTLQHKNQVPSTLIFVNRISEANELVNVTRHFLSKFAECIEGHTTDYRDQRKEVEQKFSAGHLKVLYATRGLEVGVDFDVVTCGGVYGMPFFLSDYAQRVGRIGRNRPAVIINLFMPDKPIDHFFFINWKLLCNDEGLRDKAIEVETYRIERENPEILKQNAIRALYDYLCTHNEAHYIYYDKLHQHNQKLLSALRDREAVKRYISEAVKVSTLSKDLENLIDREIDYIEGCVCGSVYAEAHSLKELIYHKNRTLFWLWSIRRPELRVTYAYAPINQERDRDLFYAFRHSVEGQIISFRGLFFAVKHLSGYVRPPGPDPNFLVYGRVEGWGLQG